MSKLEVEPEKYLTCAICQGIFNDPVTLQCEHTYCRNCVAEYIKSRRDAVREKMIPCSLRCEGTKVPEPEKPPDDWGNQLKPSFVISNLMDDYLRSTGAQCTRCRRDNTRSVAEKWCQMCGQSLCESCISSHRRDPTTHFHTITDLPQTSERQSQPFPRCDHHNDELVKLVCEDHSEAICNTCCSLNHRLCKSVVLIETKANQIIEKGSLDKTKLESKIEEVSISIATRKSQKEVLVSSKAAQKKYIREVFNKVITHIKEKEAAFLNEIDSVTENGIANIENEMELDENRLQLFQQRVYFLEQAVKSGSLFDIYKISQTLLTGERNEGDQDKTAIHQIHFLSNAVKLINELEKLDFGKIHIEYESDTLPETIDCKLPDDEERPDLYDITVMDVEGVPTLIVTDQGNKCVKSFYRKNKKVHHSRLPLDDKPKGITHWKGIVMVVVPHSKQIITVAATPDLSLVSTIHTRTGYNSVAVIDDTSMAASGDWSVDILNMDGEMVKSVSSYSSVTLLKFSGYMCVSNTGNILVSDWIKHRVTCLTQQGQVVWTYTGSEKQALNSPHGIITTGTGDTYVANRYKYKVTQLSESGQYVQDILTSQDGLKDPKGICVDVHGSLYVCHTGVVKRYTNKI